MGVFSRPKEVLKNWVYKDDDTLDAQGNDLQNVGSFSTEDAKITHAEGGLDDFSSETYFHPAHPPLLAPHPYVDNPVLKDEDVTDLNADFVADPSWYHGDILFEVSDGTGAIARATFDDYSAEYDQIILDPTYHVSMPQAFDWNGETYLHVSSSNGNFILWRFDDYPYQLTELENKSVTPTPKENNIFPFNETWWMLAENDSNNNNRLYYSDTYPEIVGGTWTEHPDSPFPSTEGRAVSGQPIVKEDQVLVPVKLSTIGVGYVILSNITKQSVDRRVTPLVTPQLKNDNYTYQQPHALDTETIGHETLALTDGSGHIAVFEPTTTLQQSCQMSATSTTTVSTQSSGGWQTVNMGQVDQNVGFFDAFPGIPKINIVPPSPMDSFVNYGGVSVSGISGTPFTLELRAKDIANGNLLNHEEWRVTDASSQTFSLTPQQAKSHVRLDCQLQIRQDSGSDLTVDAEPAQTYFSLQSAGDL